MKLQLYPVLWCLLLAFSATYATSFSTIPPSLNSTKTVVYEDVSLKNKVLKAEAENNIALTSNAVKGPLNSIKSSTALKPTDLDNLNSIEEISYNKISSNATSSTKSFTNYSRELVALKQEAKTSFQQGLYYGIAIMILFINLVCFFLFEEKLFLFYSLALGCITAVFFFNDGLISLLGYETTEDPLLIESLLLWIAVSCSALFASKYLKLEEFFPKFKFFTSPLIIVGGGLAISALVLNNVITAYTSNFVSLSILACYFVAGVLLFSRKNYAKFYVIASFIPLLFAVDFFVLRKIGVHFLSTQAIHVKVAGLVEMLILTYAIIYRMRAIKEEHEMRQTEMRIFLKRQETLNRQSAVKLMEEVYLENLIMHYDLDGLQIKLLQYISEGKDNSKIARKLKTTEAEVEEFTKELYDKLEISEHIQEDYRLLDSQPDYLYN